MLKCKHCRGTEFGVTLTEVKVTPVKMKDGEAIGMLAEPQVDQSYEVNFCFTCNKDISESDLIENETCPICGHEVPDLIDGACSVCTSQKKKLLNMTKEELILMMMKQQLNPTASTPVDKPKIKDDSKKKPAIKTKESDIKDITEDGIKSSSKTVSDSVKNSDKPSSSPNTKVTDISQIKTDETDLNLPSVSEDDILNQLDDINVADLGISDENDKSIDLPF